MLKSSDSQIYTISAPGTSIKEIQAADNTYTMAKRFKTTAGAYNDRTANWPQRNQRHNERPKNHSQKVDRLKINRNPKADNEIGAAKERIMEEEMKAEAHRNEMRHSWNEMR
ncbi:structural maintenance of chromosome 3 [Striga asiatica]|uniref:Structural maintenance of chromosome 3 n=1 Tax=Striga asiatica TaxID=4170 RepID=A0A5A7QBU9_STRAF|nr:structural maintenance of chromosome 3 [Striga asiatica]